MYFVGNVLSPTETQPEQDDPTFAFTREEAQIDFSGIPIYMEHDDKMKVGKVRSCWNNPDGSKWIVGKIDDPSIYGAFARNAVKASSSGKRYYTGLSLTHTHTQYANGKTEKQPVEVSLCVDPRRDDCRIIFVDETRIDTYKASNKTLKMSEPVDTPMPDTPAPAAPAPVETTPSVSEETAPDQEKLMRVIVDQQKDLEALEAKAKELESLKNEIAGQKKKEFEVASAKNEAMAKALVESWSNTLDQADLNDASRNQIIDLAKKFPHESQEFFRIAHHASKKSMEREQALKDAVEASKNADLKKDFKAVMNKTTHVASKKKKEEKSDKTHFMDALNKYRVTGSGRTLMEEVAQIGNKKRRRMF